MPVEKDGSLTFVDIRSLLLDGIDASIKKEKNCIIILDNLQQANSNVLESLIPVFDINTKSILIQGQDIKKRQYNIIGIIDSSMESKDTNDFFT
jgi:UTP-glucose-1-phosphate uridylyltransferase